MKKLRYSQTIYGDFPNERKYTFFFKNLDGYDFDLSGNYITFSKDGQDIIKTSVSFLEEDIFYNTWQGAFADGTSFRIVHLKEKFQKTLRDHISFASKMGNGYAVHFYLI